MNLPSHRLRAQSKRPRKILIPQPRHKTKQHTFLNSPFLQNVLPLIATPSCIPLSHTPPTMTNSSEQHQHQSLDIGDSSKIPIPDSANLSLQQIGLAYVRAAKILRSTSQFPLGGMRGEFALARIPHIINTQRIQPHPDARVLALEIEAIAAQAVGQIGLLGMTTEFVVNLEAFSKIDIAEQDVDQLKQLALHYEPVRLDTFLRYTQKGSTSRFFHELATRPVQPTSLGVRIVKREGILTSLGVVALCSLPVAFYLYHRIRVIQVEQLINVSLAILATTLLAAANPLHRMLYNNWSILEALGLRMTLNEDTVNNVRLENHRSVGIGLVANGEMGMISGDAGYASVFTKRGVNPGPLTLTVLTFYPEHWMVVDQDGKLVLIYRDGKAVELVIQGEAANVRPLKGKPCDPPKNRYVLNVGSRPTDYMMGYAAENCLVE